MNRNFEVIVIGAGAAGLMCAIEAGKRNKKVLIIEHSSKIAEKIRISGGGRCNFTNIYSNSENFLSNNNWLNLDINNLINLFLHINMLNLNICHFKEVEIRHFGTIQSLVNKSTIWTFDWSKFLIQKYSKCTIFTVID